MKKLPEEVIAAWNNREKAVILTTVDSKGIPNSIYASCVGLYEESAVVIADNYFDKTQRNILSGSPASVLFITKDGKPYQLKGSLSYKKEGPVFDFMKSWNPKRHPGKAATVLHAKEIYSGAKKIS
jgi:hypothetical protein